MRSRAKRKEGSNEGARERKSKAGSARQPRKPAGTGTPVPGHNSLQLFADDLGQGADGGFVALVVRP